MTRIANIALAAWLFVDGVVDLTRAAERGSTESLVFGILFVLLAGDVLRRRTPAATRIGPTDVTIVVASVLCPFAFMFVASGESSVGASLVSWSGVVLVWWSCFSLGSNFSVMPQRRDIVTSGPYRWVRHPMYLGYVLHDLGAWVMPGDRTALLVWLVECALLLARAHVEEQVLVEDVGYVSYRTRVRWLQLR